MNTTLKIVVALLLIGGAGYLIWYLLQPEGAPLVELVREAPERVRKTLASIPTAAEEIPNPEPEEAAAKATIAHPIETDPSTVLPSLDASDTNFLNELGALLGDGGLLSQLETQSLIRRIVVTVDNLPGGKLSMKQRPVKALGGALAVTGDDDTLTLSPANYARYEPLIGLVERINLDALAALYRRYYPLFQQAWQELGYPDSYFNDRLVAVIDHLLAAPDVSGPIALVRPNVLYVYADPELEALSPGHKILLRMGPENAARVKDLLRRWRATIAGETTNAEEP